MALPGMHQAFLFERLQGFSHNGAADVERPAERGLGGEQAAGRIAAGDDSVDEDAHNDHAQPGRAPGKRLDRPHVAVAGRRPGESLGGGGVAHITEHSRVHM